MTPCELFETLKIYDYPDRRVITEEQLTKFLSDAHSAGRREAFDKTLTIIEHRIPVNYDKGSDYICGTGRGLKAVHADILTARDNPTK